MWLLERAACTVVSERARDGVAPCFLAEIWAQIQNESKTHIYTLNPCDQGLAGRPSGGKHGFEK